MLTHFLAFFLIGVAVLVHEFGHFVAARMAGVPIKIFSVGFGPALFRYSRNQTEYRLSLFPIGGYVLPDVESEEEYFRLSVGKRLWMTAGGPLASLALPVISYSFYYVLTKGLSWETLLFKPLLQTYLVTIKLFTALPLLFTQPEQLSGIIGMVGTGSSIISAQPLQSLAFLAVISINFFILNILPIPALDGGKIFLYLCEKIHPAFLRLQFPLTLAGWVLIIGLTLFTLFIDIRKYWI